MSLSGVTAQIISVNTGALEPRPHLELRLLDAFFPSPIPCARDSKADVRDALFAIQKQNGIPAGEDLKRFIALLRETEEGKRYRDKFQSWANVAIYSLTERHEFETAQARSGWVLLAIENTGQLPADGVSVKLFFPLGLSVNKYRSKGTEVSDPPAPPSQFASTAPYPNPDERVFTPEEWFPRVQTGHAVPSGYFNGLTISRDEDGHAAAQTFRAMTDRLEHSAQIKIRPIRLSFDYGPVVPVDVNYALHASNQPKDSTGVVRIRVNSDS